MRILPPRRSITERLVAGKPLTGKPRVDKPRVDRPRAEKMNGAGITGIRWGFGPIGGRDAVRLETDAAKRKMGSSHAQAAHHCYRLVQKMRENIR
jgi:hypothetical protein